VQSSSRNGAKVLWLAVHTTEGMMRAKQLRDWAAWPGSSHAANDETGVLLTPADGFVSYDRAAWTLRNGNAISENLEQCGWAKWTRDEWLSRPKLIDTTALWLADRARARGIPLRRLTDEEIRAKKSGVLGHGDYSRATGDGTHSDPGKYFPWDVVLAKANWLLNPTPLEDDMPLNDADIEKIKHAVAEAPIGGTAIGGGKDVMLWTLLGRIANELTVPVADRTDGKFKDTALGYALENNKHAWATRQQVDKLTAAVASLTAAVEQLRKP
jgi:hypothetical protein